MSSSKLILPRRKWLLGAAASLIASPAIVRAQVPITGAGKAVPGGGGGGGEATVLIDTIGHNSTLVASTNGVTTANIGGTQCINVGSGSNGTANRCLIVIILFGSQNGGTSTITNMHWDPPPGSNNQAMTLIPGAKTANGASGGDIEMWYLMNPAIGDFGLSVNWTGVNQCSLAFASFVNVDQTGGATSFPVVQTSTASGRTINISTTPTTRKLIGAFNSGTNFTTATDNDIGHNNSMSIFAVAAEYAPGTNTTVSYGAGAGGCSAAIAIKGN